MPATLPEMLAVRWKWEICIFVY